jgi:rfaE bifunctional protein nucleotidyltransferase chain/domain
MNKIINVEKAAKLSQKLKKEGKTVVFSGGCFDILHLGHIKFLQAAKRTGDILFVFVESDENVKKIKGDNRPINNQDERAEVLSSIRFVDYVIKTPPLGTNEDYDKLVFRMNPNFIAVTKASESIEHVQRQAKKTGTKIVEVIDRIPDKSTSKIAQIIAKENAL